MFGKRDETKAAAPAAEEAKSEETKAVAQREPCRKCGAPFEQWETERCWRQGDQHVS